MGHAAHAELCISAGSRGSSVTDNLVSFCRTVVSILASVEAFSENTMKIFCVEIMRFTCKRGLALLFFLTMETAVSSIQH